MNAIQSMKLFAIMMIALALAACGNQAPDTPSGMALDGRELSWDEVEDAEGYTVEIDGETYDTDTHAFTIPDSIFGEIEVALRAYDGDDVSEWSEGETFELTRTLDAPEGLVQDGRTVSWDPVEHAEGYVLSIDGSEHVVEETSYTMDTLVSGEVRVLALGDEESSTQDSPFSQALTLSAPLNAPENLAFEDGVLSWDAVSNADHYEIKLDGTTVDTTTETAFTVSDHTGDIDASVVATSDDEAYGDSPESTLSFHIEPSQLERPLNLRVDVDTLTFDAVDHAEEYEIYVDGTLEDTISTTSYTIPSSVLDDASSYIQVKALGTDYRNSELSTRIYHSTEEVSTESELLAMEPDGAYTLSSDIELTSSWTPLEFSGFLDGSGHTISGIDIDATTENLGFFSLLDSAEILNVTLSGSIASDLDASSPSVGGLAGRVTASDITGVTVDMDLTVTSSHGTGMLGGLVGSLENTDIEDTHFNGTIQAEHFTAGGLVGFASNPEQAIDISKASATGTLTVQGGESSIAGGFLGKAVHNQLSINESYARMDVTGTSYVGGFIGYLGSAHVNDSYAEGTILATHATIVHAGGFLGRVEGYNSTITNSIAMTSVSAEHDGDYIFVGAFGGKTPGGTYATIYDNDFYDSNMTSLDRIGNPDSGRGDGIGSIDLSETSELTGFNSDTWDFTAASARLTWED